MTEEIEAHVLKKYEILQKLGKSLQSVLDVSMTECLSPHPPRNASRQFQHS